MKRASGAEVYRRAAEIFVEDEVPHVCWSLAVADGFDPQRYLDSPAVQEFQSLFAAIENGAEILHSSDMLAAVEGDEQGFREFSLWLLAFMIAVTEEPQK